jgi:hypothetical protein
VYRATQKCLQLQFDRRKVKQTGCIQRIDQQVEVTPISILTTGNRSKYAWIERPVSQDNPPYRGAMGHECFSAVG